VPSHMPVKIHTHKYGVLVSKYLHGEGTHKLNVEYGQTIVH
jgi:hypothetical protein